MLPLTSCCTQESGYCAMPAQHSRADSEGLDVGDRTPRTWKQENWPSPLFTDPKAIQMSSLWWWRQGRTGRLSNSATTQAQNQGCWPTPTSTLSMICQNIYTFLANMWKIFSESDSSSFLSFFICYNFCNEKCYHLTLHNEKLNQNKIRWRCLV